MAPCLRATALVVANQLLFLGDAFILGVSPGLIASGVAASVGLRRPAPRTNDRAYPLPTSRQGVDDRTRAASGRSLTTTNWSYPPGARIHRSPSRPSRRADSAHSEIRSASEQNKESNCGPGPSVRDFVRRALSHGGCGRHWRLGSRRRCLRTRSWRLERLQECRCRVAEHPVGVSAAG
jgi:hypothetical protein